MFSVVKYAISEWPRMAVLLPICPYVNFREGSPRRVRISDSRTCEMGFSYLGKIFCFFGRAEGAVRGFVDRR